MNSSVTRMEWILSAEIIDEMIRGYRERMADVLVSESAVNILKPLAQMRQLAAQMRDALR